MSLGVVRGGWKVAHGPGAWGLGGWAVGAVKKKVFLENTLEWAGTGILVSTET